MSNTSQEPPASSKAPIQDFKDMDVLCTLNTKIDFQNLEQGCIKDQWPSVKAKHAGNGMTRYKLELEILKDIAESIHRFLEFFNKYVEGNNTIECLDSKLGLGKVDGTPRY